MTENELIQQYTGLVRSVVNYFNPKPQDVDDYMQIGFIALIKAFRKHKKSLGKLSTIALPRIKWDIMRYINKNVSHLSLSIPANQVYEECVCDLKLYIPQTLTETEKLVLRLKLNNYTLVEIDKICGKDYRWSSKIYQRIKNKIRTANV